jgi:hypothetical protein
MGKKHIPPCMEQMTITQMRRELEYGKFGEPESPSHNFALRWLSIRESEERDSRDDKTLRLAKSANRIAWIAVIIAIIASIITIKEEIVWIIK